MVWWAGMFALSFAAMLLIGGVARRKSSTAAARVLTFGLAIWFIRYGIRLTQGPTTLGQAISGPAVLLVSAATLAIIGIAYVLEGLIE